jgi:TolB protein
MMKARLLPIVSLSLAYTCAVTVSQGTISPAQPRPQAAPAMVSNAQSELSEARGSELTGPQYTIAFKSFAPNNSDIFLADEGGSHVRPLVPDPALDYNASFSADGRWIVFTSHRAGSADIWRVHPDGSGLQRLTDDPGFEDQAALSPNGRFLAFVSSRSGQADIWILDLITHKMRNLTHHPAGDFRPAWSPDGKWIAFSSDRDRPRACPTTTQPGAGFFVTPQYRDIYIVRSDGTRLRRITDGKSETAGTPGWSQDGSHIAFYSGNVDQVCTGGLILGTGTTQIVSVEISSGKREALTTGDGLKVCPHWVGGNIVYQAKEGLRFANGRTIHGAFQAAAWSPDGHSFVFHTETDPRGDRDRPFQIWPSPDRRFALLRVPDASSFSPAGDRMVYILTNFQGDVRNGKLITANLDGSDRKVIWEGPLTQDAAGPAWSPAGNAILVGVGGFFQRAQIRSAQLMSVDPSDGHASQITHDDANNGMPSWSPDSQHVVYRVAHGSDRELHILDLATGSNRRLETGSDYDTFPSWSPRGDWIVFTSKRDGDYEIYRIRPDGTRLQRLTHLPGNDAHPAVSPDGEWVAFATSAQGFKDEAVQPLLVGTFQPYGEIGVMRIDGSEFHLLTDNATEEGAPAWAPSKTH